MRERVLAYIREHELMKPGDRVGVAVSGGADSVALLRVLLDLRNELGVVLSVIHFNHKIRGADADEDERFVAALAKDHSIEFHASSADVPAYAAEHRVSLETAGREARYAFFESFLRNKEFEAVATGHTMDDQAETVLMRVLRGAGTKGLGGIFPVKRVHDCRGELIGRIVRPMLTVRRGEVREYLQQINQSWREDATNVDLQYTRNRIRHGLIPVIETRFQPNVVQAVAQMAEVSRDEEHYWRTMVEERSRGVLDDELSRCALNVAKLAQEHIALQRRIIRTFAEKLGLTLDFIHVEQVLRLVRGRDPRGCCELPGGWVAVREGKQLRLQSRSARQEMHDYEYRLPIPGEVEVREIGRVVRAFLRPTKVGASGYNPEKSLDRSALAAELVVRNWRPGDRLWPAHSKGPKKMKELLQERHITAAERRSWPVVASADKLVWARGFGCSVEFQPGGHSKEVVVVEEHILEPRREHSTGEH
jgi:tRNA(Ile)-lysidine synthase